LDNIQKSKDQIGDYFADAFANYTASDKNDVDGQFIDLDIKADPTF
jgi:hypothetical protein